MLGDLRASGAAGLFAAAVAAGRPVVVTGADGQLAEAVLQTLGRQWRVVGLPRGDLDITSGAAAYRQLIALRPSAIVNCAAYNRVDDAEDDATTALSVNALAVGTLARAAADSEAALVHYSPDFVFDGETTRPYSEDDEMRPLGVYGASKCSASGSHATPRSITSYASRACLGACGGPGAASTR